MTDTLQRQGKCPFISSFCINQSILVFSLVYIIAFSELIKPF